MLVLSEVCLPILESIFLSNIAFAVGFFIFKKLKFNFSEIISGALSFLIGWALLMQLALVLALINGFDSFWIWFLFVLIFLASIDAIKYLYQRIYFYLKKIIKQDFLTIALFVGIFLLFLFYLMTGLMPPFQTDELAYHLSESKIIFQGGLLTLGGAGDFYGCLPLLAETFDAMLLALAGSFWAGFILIHLIHYQIVLAGIFLAFAFLKKYFNLKTGLVFLILIFSVYEFLMNSTSAYVDGLMTCFEIAGILFFCDWILEKKNQNLILTAVFFGLALSVKYTALYTLGLVGFIFIGAIIIRKYYPLLIFPPSLSSPSRLRPNGEDLGGGFRVLAFQVLVFGLPIILLSGFWYIKNLILYHNPFYPFIFNHNGFSDIYYNSLITQIHGFGKRGLFDFLLLPFKFLNPYYLTCFLGFFSLPFIFLIKNRFAKILGIFTVGFFVLWFFAVSHQARFYLTGFFLLMLVFAIVLAKILEKERKIFKSRVFISFFLILVLGLGFVVLRHKDSHFLKVKLIEAKYILGIASKQDFYDFRNDLGGAYAISDFINKNFQNKKIIMNWARYNVFLENSNVYYGLAGLFPKEKQEFFWSEVCFVLKEQGFEFLAIDEKNKEKEFKYSLFSELERLNNISAVENNLKAVSQAVFDSQKGAKVYKLNLQCLAQQ